MMKRVEIISIKTNSDDFYNQITDVIRPLSLSWDFICGCIIRGIQDKSPVFAAYLDNKFAGVLHGELCGDNPMIATVEHLYVAKQYQKQFGIGRALIQEMYDCAQDNAKTYLDVFSVDRALRFYKKCGFAEYGASPFELRKVL